MDGQVYTLAGVTISGGGTIAKGAHQVIFITDSSFAGTLAGATLAASTLYNIGPLNPGSCFDAIAYTRSAGTAIIFTW